MKFRSIILLIAAFVTISAQVNAATSLRVTGDRVSLRTMPTTEAKLVDRARQGMELTFIERSNGWVAVQAPEKLDFWVYGKLIQNDIVQSDTAYVRSAPQRLKANHVCAISKGDIVTQRAEVNGWLKIAPPAGCKLWISENYVEVIDNISSAPIASPIPPSVATMVITSMPLSKMALDDTKPQGSDDMVSGILRRASSGDYNLVQKTNGTEQTVYRVSGKQAELERYLNHAMLIKGKKYWARGVTLPFIDLETIHLGSNAKG